VSEFYEKPPGSPNPRHLARGGLLARHCCTYRVECTKQRIAASSMLVMGFGIL